VLAAGALFLGFYRNQWNVVREKKFKEFQLDSESLVIARLVETRERGLFSENGLLGWGDANPLDLNESDYAHQYEVYLSGGGFQSYSLYKSVSGSQGLLFGALSQLSPFAPAINLRNYRALMALLLALTLSIFIVWTHLEFGWATALFALATTLVSQWITLFGHNLFYFIWASFLPLGLMLFYLRSEEISARRSDLRLAMLGFAGIFFKCLMNGYDFIIPALAMPTLPVFYFGFRDGWERKRFLKRLVVLGIALSAAVATSIVVLGLQLGTSEGGFAAGLTSVFSTFSRRTYADPVLYPLYAESLAANPWSVLWTYISDDTAIEVLGLRFLDILIIFAALTFLYRAVDLARGRNLPNRVKTYALVATTWLALLSPLSWFFIFKGQAYVHTHTNYLAWHMPFTMFGYVMCACVVQSLISAFMPARGHRA
jgi:hypothetical protein